MAGRVTAAADVFTRAQVEAMLAAERRRMLAVTRDHAWVTASRLGHVVQEHLAWYGLSAAPRTLDARERRLAALCRSVPAATIQNLSPGDLMLALEQVPPRSRRVTLSHWNGFIEWAILFDKRAAKNPVKLLPRPRRYPAPAIRTFTETERARIIHAADLGLDPARDRIRAYLLLDGGFRKGECRRLRNRDIDPMRQEVIVTGKGSKERVVPLATPEFWTAWLDHQVSGYPRLDRTPEPDDFVWFPMRVAGAYLNRERQVTACYPARPMVDSGWHRWWVDLLGRAQVPYRKPHTTRHSFATATLDATEGDLYGVKELLGHESTRTTELYLHGSERRKRAAAEKLARSRGEER